MAGSCLVKIMINRAELGQEDVVDDTAHVLKLLV